MLKKHTEEWGFFVKRVMLKVAYDGTNYCGWQVQPNAKTIEGVLNECLTKLLKEEITVIGASRTDAGVHAYGNVAVFDTNSRIPAEKLSYALNAHLPQDIVIQASMETASDFHPRFCDTRKTYEYRIYNAAFPLPTNRRYAHFVYYDLDLEAMRRAASYLIGEHDFVSFCSVNTQVKDTTRTIYDIQIEKGQELIVLRIKGNGFLYNMVRIIAGTLIQVGTHQWEPERVLEVLMKKDRQAAGPTAPAKGLTLVEIEYL